MQNLVKKFFNGLLCIQNAVTLLLLECLSCFSLQSFRHTMFIFFLDKFSILQVF